MVDLDKQFAAMADVSEEDTAYDFVIDEDLRIIAIPERGVVLGVEGDKDANRIRFRMNKTWRGYDMSKFDLRINYQNANGDKNYYTVTSKHTEGNAVVFDWIVAADAVAYRGRCVLYCGGPYYHWRNGELCVPHDAWQGKMPGRPGGRHKN